MSPASVIPRLFTARQAAAYLGVSYYTILSLLSAGTLRRVIIPVGGRDLRRLLFDRLELDRLVDGWKI